MPTHQISSLYVEHGSAKAHFCVFVSLQTTPIDGVFQKMRKSSPVAWYEIHLTKFYILIKQKIIQLFD